MNNACESTARGILHSADWETYEYNVFQALTKAIDTYSVHYSVTPDERVYQISIWTDPQAQITAISFETKLHVKRQFLQEAGMSNETEIMLAAAEWEPFDLTGSPPHFEHNEFMKFRNPELSLLSELTFPDYDELVYSRIEVSLLRVVDRILNESILSNAYCEEDVWIGVNSAREWYDDLICVNVPTGIVTKA